MSTNQSLDRAFDIIELLANSDSYRGVSDIARELDLNKTTVFRILNTLIKRAYVEKNDEGKYALGIKFVALTSLHLSKVELKTEAAAVLVRLANETKLTVHLAILDGNEAVYIDKVEASRDLRLYSQIGKRVEVHCSAIGKMLISGLDNNKLDSILNELSYHKYTNNTIENKEELLNEIDLIRKNGLSFDREEHEAGIACIACAIRDYTNQVIAAISVTGKKETVNMMDELQNIVAKAALDISKRLGYGGRG